jgi:hypothetical protein
MTKLTRIVIRLRISGPGMGVGSSRKYMILSYLAEMKGIVGCQCESRVALQVLDLRQRSQLFC